MQEGITRNDIEILDLTREILQKDYVKLQVSNCIILHYSRTII